MEIMIPAVKFDLIAPILILTIAGLVTLLFGTLRSRTRDPLSLIFTLAALAAAAVSSSTLWDKARASSPAIS